VELGEIKEKGTWLTTSQKNEVGTEKNKRHAKCERGAKRISASPSIGQGLGGTAVVRHAKGGVGVLVRSRWTRIARNKIRT